MRTLFLLFFILFFQGFAFGQSAEYSRAKVNLIGHSIQELARLGVETDHGDYQKGRAFTTDLSAYEIQQIRAAGFDVEIIIEDVKAYYREQRAAYDAAHSHAQARGADCSGGTGGPSPFDKYVTPTNYTSGSMGGYHTYQELLDVLTDMQTKFPNLITEKAIVSDTITTHEGRPLYYVKMSDNPTMDEPEPEVLYTALHHSREPNGLSQMLFFMWHLLENYGTDPEVDYILDNMELYFIPCVNPDGYLYNEANDPNGGGLWRKNRRDNLDGTFGVDLNRNYGYQWGFDDDGSSPNTNSNTYRGPSAFSEPESRMVRDFAIAHDFVFCHNYHTFSNLLIIPWAYNDAPADPAFVEYADLMVSENDYVDGTASQTVGYDVNGASDDWLFANDGIFSMTPEVGPTNFGFWPPETAIDGLNKEAMFMNLITAQLPLHYARLSVSPEVQASSSMTIDLPFTIKRYSIQNADFEVSLTPISVGIAAVSAPQTFNNLVQFEPVDGMFTLTVDTANQDVELKLLANVNNGFYTRSDTVTVRVTQASQVAFEDNLINANNWNTTTGWALTTESFVSAPTSMTDSPNGDTPNNVVSELFLTNAITVPANAQDANLRFFTRWSIEEGFDLAYVEGSSPTMSPRALCGLYTRLDGFQWPDNPIYDGQQEEWVEECMSLKDFIGEDVSIAFKINTDQYVNFDGFYFDDLRVEYVLDGSVKTINIANSDFILKQNQPNPTHTTTMIEWEQVGDAPAESLIIRDANGREVFEEMIPNAKTGYSKINTSLWESGIYFYQIRFSNGTMTQAKKMVVEH